MPTRSTALPSSSITKTALTGAHTWCSSPKKARRSAFIPLAQIPAVLIGKDADTVDGYHAVLLAKAGANSDITSVSGLTTPLSRGQGGTGYNQAVAPLFACQHTPVSVTGTTTETTLFSTVIPGGTLGANGALRVMALFSHTNSANGKLLRVRFGGVDFHYRSNSTSDAQQALVLIRNRNSQSMQIGAPVAYWGIGNFGAPYGALVNASIDTSIDQSLVVTGKLTLASENITLEAVDVEVLR